MLRALCSKYGQQQQGRPDRRRFTVAKLAVCKYRYLKQRYYRYRYSVHLRPRLQCGGTRASVVTVRRRRTQLRSHYTSDREPGDRERPLMSRSLPADDQQSRPVVPRRLRGQLAAADRKSRALSP